jgi:hypothetical protein
VSFGVSAACVSLVRFRGPTRPAAETETAADGGEGRAARRAAGRMWQDLRAGAAFLRRQPVLRALTVLLSLFTFMELGLNDLIIYRIKHDLGRGDGTVGAVFAIGALGTVAGSLCVAVVRRRFGFGAAWIGAVAASGLAVAGIGAVGGVPGIALLDAGFLGCVAVAGTCSMSLRQEVTPDHLLGRVTSAFWTLHYAAAPLGAVTLTWAAQVYGTPGVCLAGGAGCVAVAGLALLTPVRSPRPEQAAALP